MMDDFSAYAIDVRPMRRAFERASMTYDAAAVLQKEVRDSLLERLLLTQLEPRVVLDVGAGTGHASRTLKQRYAKACVIAVDSAPGMLRQAARQRSWLRRFERVCADGATLPFADGSVDLLLSNLMVQWAEPERIFAEFRRVLAPRGFLSFTTLGPDTLRELRAAWKQADGRSHVNQFMDMHDIGDALVRAGFAAPVLDVDRYTLFYTTVRQLAVDLKAVGAQNATAGRPKGLTGRRTFAAMQSAYESQRLEGRLPATYEVVFGQAWAPAAAARPARSGDTEVSLEDIRRQLHARRGSATGGDDSGSGSLG